MVQSLNTKAIYTFATMVLRRPNLMVPHISVPTISDIDFAALKEYTDIRAIVFDKDHTITAPYANQIHPHAQSGLQSCIEIFGRQHVAILSNSAGTNDDINHQDAIQIETSLGIPVIRHVTKKPGGIEEVLHHFASNHHNNHNMTHLHPSQVCMIGDRILTDVVFGNLHHMLTIHTAALPHVVKSSSSSSSSSSSLAPQSPSQPQPNKDNWTAQLLRPMENKLLYRSNVFGMKRKFFATPLPHPVYDHILANRHSFVRPTASLSSSVPVNTTENAKENKKYDNQIK